MVFHCYELSNDSNAAFTFFVYLQKAFEIGNCYFPEQSEVRMETFMLLCVQYHDPDTFVLLKCTLRLW